MSDGPVAVSSTSTFEINGLTYTQQSFSNGTLATYDSNGNLMGVNIEGTSYTYNSVNNTFILNNNETGTQVTFNSDGSFVSLVSADYLITKNANGVLQNLNSNEVPANIINLCSDISISGIPTGI